MIHKDEDQGNVQKFCNIKPFTKNMHVMFSSASYLQGPN